MIKTREDYLESLWGMKKKNMFGEEIENYVDHPIIRPSHHGLFTYCPDLEQALNSTLAAESTTKAVILACSMGANLVTLDQQEARELHQNYLKNYHPTRS